MTTPNQNPEQIARDQIDTHLAEAGSIVQDKRTIDFNAGLGIAVREYQTDIGPADYVLFVAAKAVGVIGRLVISGLQWGQAIQRAHDVFDGVGGDARVVRGRIELRVPQKNLDHTDIAVLLKLVRCKAVPQGMRGDALGDLGHLGRRVAGAIDLRFDIGLIGSSPGNSQTRGSAMRSPLASSRCMTHG